MDGYSDGIGTVNPTDIATVGIRMQSAILEAFLRVRDRGIVPRGYVDKDAQINKYYTSTNVWEHEIENIRDHLARELGCYEEITGCTPCEQERPSRFERPLQCLAYDLGEERIFVAVLAARKSFAAVSFMPNRFLIVDNEHIWTGMTNLSN